MKLITFVMAVQNRFGLKQRDIYENVLKYFDVIDAIMCLNGDCLAVCRSTATDTDEPAAFLDFIAANNTKDALQIVDRHDDVDLLLERMYNIVEMFNGQ
ncbi:ac117-like protein [Alphabaculovirus altersperidaniae]|uniref:Ac117-like protein n=1 Tax=Spodoptera eridania nucleopolyhedrovirus TaxID=2315721 RepID=A0ABX6TQW3_9ABAC|nr:ac117-like protein [Spodoptera eridania nucleopolyhedrovirus]QNV47870.1 ac117-like protein [Spodoptera eridania nucleopolyhedrovirus]